MSMIRGAFYTKGEAASALGKNVSTIYRWLQNGKIHGQRAGNMMLISEDEVRRLQATLDSREPECR